MPDVLQYFLFIGFAGLMFLLRLDARRFGAAEWDTRGWRPARLAVAPDLVRGRAGAGAHRLRAASGAGRRTSTWSSPPTGARRSSWASLYGAGGHRRRPSSWPSSATAVSASRDPARYPGGILGGRRHGLLRRVPLPRRAPRRAALAGRCRTGWPSAPRPLIYAGAVRASAGGRGLLALARRAGHRRRGRRPRAHDGRHRGGPHGPCHHSLRGVHDHGLPAGAEPVPLLRARPPARRHRRLARLAHPAARRARRGGDGDDGRGAAAARSVLPDAAAVAPAGRPPGRADRPALPPEGLYVHIPFCVSLCPYCDFVVLAGAAARGPRNRIAALLEAAAHASSTCERRGSTAARDDGPARERLPRRRHAIAAAARRRSGGSSIASSDRSAWPPTPRSRWRRTPARTSSATWPASGRRA